jgi:hypothetical protein
MSIESKTGRREEKRKKMGFITWKSLFLFLLFYDNPLPLIFKDELKKNSS